MRRSPVTGAATTGSPAARDEAQPGEDALDVVHVFVFEQPDRVGEVVRNPIFHPLGQGVCRCFKVFIILGIECPRCPLLGEQPIESGRPGRVGTRPIGLNGVEVIDDGRHGVAPSGGQRTGWRRELKTRLHGRSYSSRSPGLMSPTPGIGPGVRA
jgi:hypothetical protein